MRTNDRSTLLRGIYQVFLVYNFLKWEVANGSRLNVAHFIFAKKIMVSCKKQITPLCKFLDYPASKYSFHLFANAYCTQPIIVSINPSSVISC